MNLIQKRLLRSWLVDFKVIKDEQVALDSVLPNAELKISISPENTGVTLPSDLSDLKFVAVYVVFLRKGNNSIIKELTSNGYTFWENVHNSKKFVTANKVLNVQEEFSVFYENLIQCEVCGNTFTELEVNITDYDEDTCLQCEKKRKVAN